MDIHKAKTLTGVYEYFSPSYALVLLGQRDVFKVHHPGILRLNGSGCVSLTPLFSLFLRREDVSLPLRIKNHWYATEVALITGSHMSRSQSRCRCGRCSNSISRQDGLTATSERRGQGCPVTPVNASDLLSRII